ncbi:MAG: hypothetical protein QME94_05535, partial [Anaerolineae bacterium]|nr:hypothetical protein [Anaerolineae bacterium]
SSTAFAWDRHFTSAPYTGNFWLSTTSTHQAGCADWIRWNADGVAAMRQDIWPLLDMTADCTLDNPGMDQLTYDTYYSNIPNDGVWVWTDCGSDYFFEEVELRIRAGQVVAEQPYFHQVHYRKNKLGVNGAINLTYERTNLPQHDWLAKVLYSQ